MHPHLIPLLIILFTSYIASLPSNRTLCKTDVIAIMGQLYVTSPTTELWQVFYSIFLTLLSVYVERQGIDQCDANALECWT